jgi:predicted nucleic acid-binding Zn finger protein
MKVQLIKTETIVKNIWLVESESVEGASYVVTKANDEYVCSCPHYIHRGNKCKHILEVNTNE